MPLSAQSGVGVPSLHPLVTHKLGSEVSPLYSLDFLPILITMALYISLGVPAVQEKF